MGFLRQKPPQNAAFWTTPHHVRHSPLGKAAPPWRANQPVVSDKTWRMLKAKKLNDIEVCDTVAQTSGGRLTAKQQSACSERRGNSPVGLGLEDGCPMQCDSDVAPRV